MHRISRAALRTAAVATVLAVTAVAPSAVGAGRPVERPAVGSGAAAARGTQHTVTLITGDRVLVTDTPGGGPAAVAPIPAADGTTPLVELRTAGDDVYAYPARAAAAIAAGTLDEELFNVTGLIRQGYDDARTGELPLIATYDTSVDVARSLPPLPRAVDRGTLLEAIHGVALKADKDKASAFFADATDPRSRSGSRLKKLWLDKKVDGLLAESTKQVHADSAWASGYTGEGTAVAVLDTGVDQDHPDLKGRVSAAKDFTDSPSGTDDVDGHGTHTASTVGGSGAASDGVEKGVAPGTDLLIGKVLGDSGEGSESGVIAGMQWAVDQRADVVSMSLGSPDPSDCTDPMSQAVGELTKSTKTLFVVAAGNLGPGRNTVTSPGCAPGVLTVGAVDGKDATAPFSSRGPVTGAHTLKPEIAAPGVAISAAEAGTDGYVSMSGTSMAAPHVAGAAALVRQRHPSWTAQQVKAALVGAADTDVPGDIKEVGGGRLDVAAALGQSVLSAPAVQAGAYDWPHTDEQTHTVDVPYTNTSDKDVTLRLSVDRLIGHDGKPAPPALATLKKTTVTVKAGESVSVPLAISPNTPMGYGGYGDITGRVTATGDNGVHVSIPFALYLQPKSVKLTVKMIDRQGNPASGSSSVDVIGTDSDTGERRYNAGKDTQTYAVTAGSYLLSSFVTTPTNDGQLTDSVTYLARPQLTLTEDTTVVLDARDAHPLSVRTDRPTEPAGTTLAFSRGWGTWQHSGSMTAGVAVRGVYADVEGRATDGTYEFGDYWRRSAPVVQRFEVARPGPDLALHPRSLTAFTSGNLDGHGTARVIDGGTGTADELAAADVKDAFVLIRADDTATSITAQARTARDAGAKAVLVYRTPDDPWQPANASGLPAYLLGHTEAERLINSLNGGANKATWHITAKVPYTYTLAFPTADAVAEARRHTVHDTDLSRTDVTYRAMGVATDYSDAAVVTRPSGQSLTVGAVGTIPAPAERAEYTTTGGGTLIQHRVASSRLWGETMLSTPREPVREERREETWYGDVVGTAPGREADGSPVLTGERQGHTIGYATGGFWADGDHRGVAGSSDVGNLTLLRDGKEVGRIGLPYGSWTVPDGKATYELRQSLVKLGPGAPVWLRSTQVDTAWTFTSQRDNGVTSQGLPLLYPHVSLGSAQDGLKTLPARSGLSLGVSASGHAGYRAGALTAVDVAYSYDGGETWTKARTRKQKGNWSALVDHTGKAGRQVTLRVRLTDTNGARVIQTIARAYDVR
ncbi:S8 family serine peptidase [Streptomyces sp. NBC_00063]|uniref:S8 family serine peptidase n=1 Tax=Streptomyces sp. NBC_00063 TaxID=2975638 RepID=UPI003D724DB3